MRPRRQRGDSPHLVRQPHRLRLRRWLDTVQLVPAEMIDRVGDPVGRVCRLQASCGRERRQRVAALPVALGGLARAQLVLVEGSRWAYGTTIDQCCLFSSFDRIGNAPRGRDGGKDGATGTARLDDGTELKPKGWQHVPAGRRLVLHLPGGGGYGDPALRDTDARAEDILKGYVSGDRK